MSDFQKAFLELYEPVMKSKGFSRKRYVFHRLVSNQVVQKLSYCMFGGQQEFTIQFGFEPLCAGGEIEVFMDERRLGTLWGNEVDGYGDTNNPAYLQETLRLCQKYLFPLFDTITDYQSFYAFEMENHQKGLELSSDRYKEANKELLTAPMSDAFFCASMSTSHYDMAQKSREALILVSARLNGELQKSCSPFSPIISQINTMGRFCCVSTTWG